MKWRRSFSGNKAYVAWVCFLCMAVMLIHRRSNSTKTVHIMYPQQIYSAIFPENAHYLHVTIMKRPFLISNSKLCTGSRKINHVIMVHSSAEHFDRRQSYRDTWANPEVFGMLNARTVFILGRPSSEETQDEIVRESEKHGDIVQGDFLDRYDNLTLKAMTGFRWISEHCSNSQSVIKVDDDVFVDIFRVVWDYLPLLRAHSRQLICWSVFNDTIVRDANNEQNYKWAIPKHIFPGYANYPMPFCFGYSVFLSTHMVEQLYKLAKSTPFFRLDDVYVYGILANMVPGVTWRNEGEFFTKSSIHTSSFYRRFILKHPYVVETSTDQDSMKTLWELTKNNYMLPH